MEAAGRAVAEVVQDRAPSGPVAVLCGPGNNGGDGFVAARRLQAEGRAVTVWLLGDRAALRGDAAGAAGRWTGPVHPLGDLRLDEAAVVVDALFGAGLARDLAGAAREAVDTANCWAEATGGPIVAIDVPSGLDGDSGRIRGAAIRAAATVTFFRFKPGHFLDMGPDLCGEIVLADIGIPERVLEAIAPKTFLNGPDLWGTSFPVPGRHGHKYSRGHCVVVSGDPWHTGAARLAATACLRAGAGLVTLASPRAALAINAGHLTGVMMSPCDEAGELAALLSDPRKNVTVLGPGLGIGAATAALVRCALTPRPGHPGAVVDADALTAFSGRGAELAALAAAFGPKVVLTPHDGEFARLFNDKGLVSDSNSQLSTRNETAFHSKLDRSKNAASSVHCTLLLKGADTVVASPDGRASIARDLPPWLATAGSGDVLAGMIGGLLAQGMPAFEAASAAVWLHGQAARAFGPGLLSEDLPGQIPAALGTLLPRLR
jgi:hydroxyethylthiazole kinase-like uncharacterized protein yjeF